MPDAPWLEVRLPRRTWELVTAAIVSLPVARGPGALEVRPALEELAAAVGARLELDTVPDGASLPEPALEDPDPTTFIDLPPEGEFPDLEPWRPAVTTPPRAMSVEDGLERLARASDHDDVPRGSHRFVSREEAEATGERPTVSNQGHPAHGLVLPTRAIGLPEVVEAVDHLRVVLAEWLDIIEGASDG